MRERLALTASFCMAVLVLTGCSKGKQQAAVALESARLNVASAENAGAGRLAPELMEEAKGRLLSAERHMKAGDYAQARKIAADADMLANRAKDEAAAAVKKKAGKPAAKPAVKKKK